MFATRILLSTAVLLAIGGCMHGPHHPHGGGASPFSPKVTVDGNAIRTDQEVLVFPRGSKEPVTFSLPESSPYHFGKDGIVIEGRITDQLIKSGDRTVAVVNTSQRNNTLCTPSDKGLKITCDRSKAEPGVYKYTIRLRRGDAVALERDPIWVEQ